MLAASWKAGMVMLSSLKISFPAMANARRMPAITQQANRAVRLRCCGLSLGVMAMKAGMVAIGSTITKSDVAASRMYSARLNLSELATDDWKSQLSKSV